MRSKKMPNRSAGKSVGWSPERSSMWKKAYKTHMKKQGKKFVVDTKFLKEHRKKPPTLENLYKLMEGVINGKADIKECNAVRVYFLDHLAEPAERKFVKKAILASMQDNRNGFARALLESKARKYGQTEAKKMLLEELDKTIRSIDNKTKQFMHVAIGKSEKAKFVRHEGIDLIRQGILQPVKEIYKEIAKL